MTARVPFENALYSAYVLLYDLHIHLRASCMRRSRPLHAFDAKLTELNFDSASDADSANSTTDRGFRLSCDISIASIKHTVLVHYISCDFHKVEA